MIMRQQIYQYQILLQTCKIRKYLKSSRQDMGKAKVGDLIPLLPSPCFYFQKKWDQNLINTFMTEAVIV